MIKELDAKKIIFNDINNQERRELITNKLIKFNKSQSKKVEQCYELENHLSTIEIYAELKPQKLIGGLIGYIDWGWLDIDIIWIDGDYRGKGIGKKLVKSAEQKAIDNSIKKSKLYTFDFQALPFYEKLGYTIYGKLEDYPEGHTVYYLKKNLS
ncbi:MAG: GNAT family N-acetyltransferase [Waterburya sp.]